MKNNSQKNISNLVKTIVADYKQNRDIDANLKLPDKSEIIKILYNLQNIIFYGYFNDKSTIKHNLKTKLNDIYIALSKQIAIALKHLPIKSHINRKSKTICTKFLKKLPYIRQLVQTDLDATFDGDPAAFNKAEITVASPGFFAIMVSRLAHELHLLKVPILPRMMTEFAHTQTGIDIHPGAKIGKYFFIDHGTGIVIGETTVIGQNVKIYQGVTLGALSTKGGQKLHGKKRHPTIKDNVTIYANATILGGETVVGKNSVVGGNCFITSSLPDNSKVSNKI